MKIQLIKACSRIGSRVLNEALERNHQVGGNGNISAEDYAVALLDAVEDSKHFQTTLNVNY